MKINKAIERLEAQLNTLSEIVEKPLSDEQEKKVIEILEQQGKVITSLENTAQQQAV